MLWKGGESGLWGCCNCEKNYNTKTDFCQKKRYTLSSGEGRVDGRECGVMNAEGGKVEFTPTGSFRVISEARRAKCVKKI
jgi:hypothetical protein